MLGYIIFCAAIDNNKIYGRSHQVHVRCLYDALNHGWLISQGGQLSYTMLYSTNTYIACHLGAIMIVTKNTGTTWLSSLCITKILKHYDLFLNMHFVLFVVNLICFIHLHYCRQLIMISLGRCHNFLSMFRESLILLKKLCYRD